MATLTISKLNEVVHDIKVLTADDSSVLQSLGPAFAKYNHEQLTTVKLPGGSQPVHDRLKHFSTRYGSTEAYDRLLSVHTMRLEMDGTLMLKAKARSLSTTQRRYTGQMRGTD